VSSAILIRALHFVSQTSWIVDPKSGFYSSLKIRKLDPKLLNVLGTECEGRRVGDIGRKQEAVEEALVRQSLDRLNTGLHLHGDHSTMRTIVKDDIQLENLL